ncbi:MAG: hypothetical protein J6J43_08705 [Oscillospiraceae bacterium]|nr:hypothetical protein [Oscillospiraceae bacterium]
MRMWKKVILIVLAVLILLLGGLYLWQRENIHALIKVFVSDSQVIADELDSKRAEHHEAMEEAAGGELTVKPVTTEQGRDLIDGKVTADEVKDAMGVAQPTETEAVGITKQNLVDQCVAELYAYKVDVMAYLGGLKQAAIDQWNGLEKSQRTSAKKMEISMDGLRKCYAYEAQVDGRVQEILASYRAKMAEIGEDSKPIDDLWYFYCDEKEAEKAYYFDRYLN